MFLRSTSIAAVLAACVTPCLLDAARAQNVTGPQVLHSIAGGVRYLKAAQRGDGSWAEGMMEGGSTALATLALLNAGVPQDDPVMRRALEAVRRIPLQATYVVSLKAQVLANADPAKYAREIQAAADWLVRSQRGQTGMWGYTIIPGGGDFSNTQFALLGLHEAARAGARVPEPVWRAAERAWIMCQQRDGGWGYSTDPAGSTGSMTSAGIASLFITGNSLNSRNESGFIGGAAPRCGRYSEYKPIARGLEWLSRNFSVQNNPPSGSWYYYYMYAMERVGILSGQRYFGRHDWYRAGAAALVSRQARDGHWDEGLGGATINTSFALLFLAKGHKSLLFHKLQWSSGQQWNLDRNDIAHLTAFIGDRLGAPVAWEVVGLEAKLEEWRAAPILYFNGHTFPPFSPEHVKKLREFVEQGGTILAEACCGRPEFAGGFRAFAKQAWPEIELARLPADHPVFKTLFDLDGSQIHLEGVGAGCRTSVFFSPEDLSCLWEQGDVPNLSEPALQLGANIAAYATGREPLPDRLDVVRLAKKTAEPTASAPVQRGAVHIGQLMHNGDWRPDPNTLPHLAEYLNRQLGIDVVPQYEAIKATDPRLADHPILYMTGHYTFRLAPDEVSALREHLRRGGFLFVDACCGRKAFDVSFRELAGQLFPQNPLEPIPKTHPILAGSPGIPILQVTYKQPVLNEQPNLKTPMLEGVTIEGRTAVVYSPYSLGCSLDGHTCFSCRGVANPDASTLAGNIILYALSY